MKTPFKSSAVAFLTATGVIASTAAALAAVSVGDQLGTTEEDIRTALTSQGYTVEEIETEDGKLEAEVTMDGQEMDVVVDAKSGLVLELELEGEDDGDKDNN